MPIRNSDAVSPSPALQQLGRLAAGGAENRRNREQEDEPRRLGAAQTDEQRDGDRGARPRDAGHERQPPGRSRSASASPKVSDASDRVSEPARSATKNSRPPSASAIAAAIAGVRRLLLDAVFEQQARR